MISPEPVVPDPETHEPLAPVAPEKMVEFEELSFGSIELDPEEVNSEELGFDEFVRVESVLVELPVEDRLFPVGAEEPVAEDFIYTVRSSGA